MADGSNRVVCVGEALVDFIPEPPVARLAEARSFAPRFGGSQANIAFGAARLGAPSALIGSAGVDPWGRWLRATLAAEGVDVSHFALREDMQTPHAFVAMHPDGEPEFSFFGGDPRGCLPHPWEPPAGLFAGGGVFIFGSDTLITERDREMTNELKRVALGSGWHVLFDPNLRAGRWEDAGLMIDVALEALAEVSVVKANAEEASALTGEREPGAAAGALAARGPTRVLVTAASDGVFLAGGRDVVHVPARPARVRDATGAGDAVAAVVAAALARWGDVTPAAVAVATEVAGRVVEAVGALDGLPPPEEARALLDAVQEESV
jgi:fructokinase